MAMQSTTQTIEVPKALLETWKTERNAEKHLIEAAVLELVREGILSSGRAAELLGMTRHEFLALMSKRGVPHVQFSSQELSRQKEESYRLA